MWTDEIVEETRKTREAYAVKFNYDLEAIYRDLKEQEKRYQHRVVSLLPKSPETIPQAKAS